MISRAITPTLLACIAAFAAGCGSDDDAPKTTTPPDDGNRLVVCTSVPFEPAEFVEEGELVGYDIDIMDAVAEHIDLDVDWEQVEFDQILDELDDGTCDAAIASIAMTEERLQKADLVPYLMGTKVDPDAPEGPDAEVPDPDAPPLGIATRRDDDLHEKIQSAVSELYADGSMRSLLEQWDATDFMLEGELVSKSVVEE